MSTTGARPPSVVVVGGGFAGVGCAKELGTHGVQVTLLDRHNYHQFQPLLYQVATAEISATDVARSLRSIFRREESVDVKQLEVVSIDPVAMTVTGQDGLSFPADYIVVAGGSSPNFYRTPGADEHAFPLYSLTHAKRLRTRLFEVFEEADTDPSRIDQGALNVVIVGGGPTGVETAGAVADLIRDVMPARFHDLPVDRARIYLVDHGPVVLSQFSPESQEYAAKRLKEVGVTLLLGTGVEDVRADRVVLSDGNEILTRTVVWAGGIQAPAVAAASGLPRARTGRIVARADLTVEGYPHIYAIGDIAAMPGADGTPLPQLGSVALQAGRWAAQNILADLEGRPLTPFHYRDKGIMAMIGDGAAIAEIGSHHHELHGHVGFAAWLGVHAWLMSGVRQRVDAFISWAWDFFGSSRSSSIIDDPDTAKIDWGDDGDDEGFVPSDAPAAAQPSS